MRRRTLAILVLTPLGALVAFGIARMIQHDFTVGPKIAQGGVTHSSRTEVVRETRETDKGEGRAVADEMLAIYRKTRGTPEQAAGAEQFAKLAATVEFRYLIGIMDALEAPQEPREQAQPYLLSLYVRWIELEPAKAWERVRRDAGEAKKAEDRAWAVERIVAMLAKWVHADAPAALTAFLEVERGAKGLRDDWEWLPGCDEFFTAAAEAAGAEFPARLRGLGSPAMHAGALNIWGTLQVHAGANPLGVAEVLGAESIAAVTDEEGRAEFQRVAETGLFTAWLQRDADAAMEWFASGNDVSATVLMLEKIARAGGNGSQVAGRFLLSRPPEVRDGWILAYLHQTGGLNLELLPHLSNPELRWKCLRQAAWPKVAEEQEGFVPWACDPTAVREAMKLLDLDDAHRAEIEQILSVR